MPRRWRSCGHLQSRQLRPHRRLCYGGAVVTLKLYTDFVCPFCFIAEQSSVPQLLREFELELDWCGFELHPNTPPGGRPLSDLFPGVDLDALHERTREFAARFGVTDFSPPKRLQNTQRALAVAEVARDAGRLEALRQAAFEAHWRQGADLEADEALLAIADAAGLAPRATLAAADEPSMRARVQARQADARRVGVSGIPTFVIGQERVVGCQPYSTLAAMASRVGAARQPDRVLR